MQNLTIGLLAQAFSIKSLLARGWKQAHVEMKLEGLGTSGMENLFGKCFK